MPNEILTKALYAMRAVNPDVIEEGGDDKLLRQLASTARELLEWVVYEQGERDRLRNEVRCANG